MSPRSKEQNEHIRDERREQLLSAALKVFSRRGLAATKIGDIAAAANMSHGLVYHYFKSKEDVFVELVRRAVTSADALMTQIGAMALEPLDRIRTTARLTLDALGQTEEAAYYFYLMAQAITSDAAPEGAKQILREFASPAELVARAAAEGQAKGLVREGDPMQYATVFWATVQGLAAYRVANSDRFPMPDSGFLVRMFEP